MAKDDTLAVYKAKRNFAVTTEPSEGGKANPNALSFVVQKHAASRLHYDFRLELDGVMVSWAVPKGPSFDPKEKRMAIHVEDHPISYSSFEGTIPPKQYGAGTVIVWDRGTWEPVGNPRAGLKASKLVFRLHGQKLEGLCELVKIASGLSSRSEQCRQCTVVREPQGQHRAFDAGQGPFTQRDTLARSRQRDGRYRFRSGTC